MHLLHIRDFFEVCRILALPSEIADYFAFREQVLLQGTPWQHHEARLLAAFIAEDPSGTLDDDAVRVLLDDALHDVESFDLGTC